jgi:hypothetical protein
MPYTVTSDTVGLAAGPLADTANDVHEALGKARQMYETGLANVSITDETRRKIDGDDYPRSRSWAGRRCSMSIDHHLGSGTKESEGNEKSLRLFVAFATIVVGLVGHSSIAFGRNLLRLRDRW